MSAALDGKHLLRAIIADPADDAVRLVYADWLEEQGDEGSSARAEFIRLQQADPLNTVQIEGGGYYLWRPDDRGGFCGVRCPEGVELATVRGGFVERVRLPLDAWRRHGPVLVRRHPLRRVELSDREPVSDAGGAGWIVLADPGRHAVPGERIGAAAERHAVPGEFFGWEDPHACYFLSEDCDAALADLSRRFIGWAGRQNLTPPRAP